MKNAKLNVSAIKSALVGFVLFEKGF